MEDKNIRRENQPGQHQKDLEDRGQQSRQQENTGQGTGENINVSNPQQGNEWSNYRTRELSTNENNSSSDTLNDE